MTKTEVLFKDIEIKHSEFDKYHSLFIAIFSASLIIIYSVCSQAPLIRAYVLLVDIHSSWSVLCLVVFVSFLVAVFASCFRIIWEVKELMGKPEHSFEKQGPFSTDIYLLEDKDFNRLLWDKINVGIYAQGISNEYLRLKLKELFACLVLAISAGGACYLVSVVR